MSNRHRVFVSFYHEDDQEFTDYFETLFYDIYDIYVSETVKDGDIGDNLSTERIHQIIRDKHLRDSTVTVVLVGAHTWRRKFVDWEIGSSIRHTELNPRSGLLGILLPAYYTQWNRIQYPYTIPPRLYDNIKCGYATIHNWSENPSEVQDWIHDAFKRRKEVQPNNARPSFKNNRSGERWYD